MSSRNPAAAALTEVSPNNDSPPRDGIQYENSVVFIHGYNGHFLQTWTSDNTDNPGKLPWPLLFLLPDLSWTRSQILTFNYDAKVWNRTGNFSQGILELAQRLMQCLVVHRRNCTGRQIVFVAHSMGGLVVKKMLMMADSYPGHSDIVISTAAVLFFGTPHRGLPAILGAPLRTMFFYNRLAQQLRSNSDMIQSLEQSFPMWLRRREEQGHQIHVCCFFEMKPTRLLGFLPGQFVVDRRSATIDGLGAIGIDSDHSGIVKFPTRDGDYVLFLHELRKVLPAESRPNGATDPDVSQARGSPTLITSDIPEDDPVDSQREQGSGS
ncbi:hypothetical protein CMUS01_11537 [Colletotrichum musicola]|uniref:DUF676 domain-containing protein n=1 Tax=Colletotrichum musicola TaxID=2175873 RepID=A0A8H6N5V6_9PEZI|nr:hypothetical protein CMUS01_11537 [Colletotrichum musicola]